MNDWQHLKRKDLLTCELGSRIHDWPRGYPGDAVTVDLICGPRPEEEVGGALWDFVLARGHRNRLQILTRLWEECLLRFQPPRPPREEGNLVLTSLGCGHARDLETVSHGLRPADKEVIPLRLIDLDQQTLNRAIRNVRDQGYRDIIGVEMDLTKIVKNRFPYRSTMSCCAGLFDYLKESTCVKILRQMAASSDQVVFTNVDETHMTMEERQFMWRVLNWDLRYRTQKTVIEMARAVGLKGYVITDETLTQNIFVGTPR